MRFVVIYLALALVIYLRGVMPAVHDRKKQLWCMLVVLPGAFFPGHSCCIPADCRRR